MQEKSTVNRSAATKDKRASAILKAIKAKDNAQLETLLTNRGDLDIDINLSTRSEKYRGAQRFVDVALEMKNFDALKILFKHGAHAENPRELKGLLGYNTAQKILYTVARGTGALSHIDVNKILDLYCYDGVDKGWPRGCYFDVIDYRSIVAHSVLKLLQNESLQQKYKIIVSAYDREKIEQHMKEDYLGQKPESFCTIF